MLEKKIQFYNKTIDEMDIKDWLDVVENDEDLEYFFNDFEMFYFVHQRLSN